MRRFHFWMIASVMLMCACEESVTGPDRALPRVHSTCVPSGPNVSCTAILYDVPSFGSSRDVTSEATWLVSDASIGVFPTPGFFTPRMHGEVGVWVRFDQWEEDEDLHSWFLVDPNRPAQRLYFLAGTVMDETNRAPLSGAVVRILDGYSRNASGVTNENGFYKIDRILTGQAFSARASMTGYASLTQSYRVDSPVGPAGNGPFLNFLLHPELQPLQNAFPAAICNRMVTCFFCREPHLNNRRIL